MHINNNISSLCNQLNEIMIIIKMREAIKNKEDSNTIQNEEKIKRLGYWKGNEELLEINKYIHNSLRKDIDYLLKLALKNKLLNQFALKKDDKKYEFSKDKNIQKNKKNEIYEIFNKTFDNMENLYANENIKEETVNKIQRIL